MPLLLPALLGRCPTAAWDGVAPELPVSGLAYDSRAVRPGDLFFCLRGDRFDGHNYLAEVARLGAAAAIVDREVPHPPLPAVRVASVRALMPHLAAAFHGYPSRRLHLVGVTGTNGKTTTTYLVEAIRRQEGYPTGVIGTIATRIGAESLPADRTTPEAPDLQDLLAKMADSGHSMGARPRTVAMEVSSHALAQGRTLGCEFDVAVFTNLTQDHLDYHRTMEEYFEAKAALFSMYPSLTSKPTTAVVNVDDPYGRRLLERCPGNVMTYGLDADAMLRAAEIEASASGTKFLLRSPEGEHWVTLPLGGRFNIYNSLAAMGAARALGTSWETILTALSCAAGAPGRFESVDEGQEFGVIVDYAHTPDGLENVLLAARALKPRRLIVLFGCGGDRDRTKRPMMGEIAARLADLLFVTSDNPRSEDPGTIIAEIAAGIAPGTAAEHVLDRRAAIEQAVASASSGDILVIAGKGHEDYQIFADRTIHFDDREEARRALRARLSA
jgi:UDP-N-acetylmuramoyl-L-alanyl-D-glutamate--2,6-diaminopimelate ligase